MSRLVVVLLVVAACSGPLSPESVAGTYRLDAINGQPLPRAKQEGTATIYTTSGELGLHADGTWYYSLNYRAVSQSGTTQTFEGGDSGTYTLSGSTATLTVTRFHVGDVYTAAINGEGLAVTIGGDAYHFTLPP